MKGVKQAEPVTYFVSQGAAAIVVGQVATGDRIVLEDDAVDAGAVRVSEKAGRDEREVSEQSSSYLAASRPPRTHLSS